MGERAAARPSGAATALRATRGKERAAPRAPARASAATLCEARQRGAAPVAATAPWLAIAALCAALCEARQRGAAPFAATAPWLAVAALCAALASCGGPKEPPAYPYVADRPRVLFATAEGLSAARPAAVGATAAADRTAQSGGPDAAASGARVSLTRNASVLTADSRSIVAAINGFGYARIEAAPPDQAAGADGRGARRRARAGADASGVAYRVVNAPMRGCMDGLTTAGAWPIEGGFLIQLYLDPFSAAPGLAATAPGLAAAAPGGAAPSDGTAGAGGAARLIRIGAIEGESVLPCPAADEGFELFALFPCRGADGAARWLGELRRDTRDSVELRFFEADSPFAETRPVGREAFESALSPKSLFALQGLEGAALRAAIAALGPGNFLVRYRSPSGEDAWYLSGGRVEDSAQAWAWAIGSGRVIALSASGRLADAGSRATRTVELGSPAAGASYTALAAASGIVAAAWETGTFPKVDAAGLVIAPLGR